MTQSGRIQALQASTLELTIMLFLGWVLVAFGLIGYIATYMNESNAVFPWTILFLGSAIVGSIILAANGINIVELD